MEDLKPREKFLKIYANLPFAIREEIIGTVFEEEHKVWRPVTWNSAFIEIKNNTDISKNILEHLTKLNII